MPSPPADNVAIAPNLRPHRNRLAADLAITVAVRTLRFCCTIVPRGHVLVLVDSRRASVTNRHVRILAVGVILINPLVIGLGRLLIAIGCLFLRVAACSSVAGSSAVPSVLVIHALVDLGDGYGL